MGRALLRHPRIHGCHLKRDGRSDASRINPGRLFRTTLEYPIAWRG